MYGGDTPGQIWEDFMNAANKAAKYEIESFPEGSFVGDPSVLANGVSPAPKAPENPNPGNNPNSSPSCQPFDFNCLFGNNPNNGGNNNGGNNNGGNNPGGNPTPPAPNPTNGIPGLPGNDDDDD